jgi:hypothetical protein
MLVESTATEIETGFSIWKLIKNYWFWLIIGIILIPVIISSISYAIQTSNPLYPVFQISSKLFVADNIIQKDVALLATDPIKLIGMVKPTAGIWNKLVYFFNLFKNVYWEILTNIILIFFPLRLIKIIIDSFNNTSPLNNWMKSIGIFLIYVFITNTIILVHDLSFGTRLITIQGSTDVFKEYLYTIYAMMPFHGIIDLVKFIITGTI